MRSVTRLLTVAAIVLGMAAVPVMAGCANTIDADKAEEEITDDAEGDGLDVEEVKCPDDVDAKDGEKFDCDVELGGGQDAEVEVEVTSDDGDLRYNLSPLFDAGNPGPG
jgi:uncharacterized protein DUF4333